MLAIHQIEPTTEDWARMNRLPDRLVYQTPEWMAFVAETQDAQPVVGEVRDGSSVVGYFSGLTFRRFGVRILGSPFPGWTTMYLGFNLEPEVPRWQALAALERFAFRDIGCLHYEVADRYLTTQDAARVGVGHGSVETYEHDLKLTEDQLFNGMKSACRRCVRKAEKSGVTIEQASDEGFAAEYYDQLKEVFLKQGLVPTYDLARVQALIRHLGSSGNLLLLRARGPGGEGIATGIYPGMNRIAQFWGNASHRSGQQYRPNELLHWTAMKYWKQRGVESFDWGGGGAYKEKYGCTKILIPWFRKSRFRALEKMREVARQAVYTAQRTRGRLRGRSVETEP